VIIIWNEIDTAVEFFDSLEEVRKYLAEAKKAADAGEPLWQATIMPGEYFIAVGGDYFFVFGEVLKHYEKMHRRYYRFCRYYCVACPGGEVGDVHVSTILCLISRGLFEQLRQEGWEVRTRPGVHWSCVPPDGR